LPTLVMLSISHICPRLRAPVGGGVSSGLGASTESDKKMVAGRKPCSALFTAGYPVSSGLLTDSLTLLSPSDKMTRASSVGQSMGLAESLCWGRGPFLLTRCSSACQECVTSQTQQVHLCSWSVAPAPAQTGPDPGLWEKGEGAVLRRTMTTAHPIPRLGCQSCTLSGPSGPGASDVYSGDRTVSPPVQECLL
jgi:hypothetical protein